MISEALEQRVECVIIIRTSPMESSAHIMAADIVIARPAALVDIPSYNIQENITFSKLVVHQNSIYVHVSLLHLNNPVIAAYV